MNPLESVTTTLIDADPDADSTGRVQSSPELVAAPDGPKIVYVLGVPPYCEVDDSPPTFGMLLLCSHEIPAGLPVQASVRVKVGADGP